VSKKKVSTKDCLQARLSAVEQLHSSFGIASPPFRHQYLISAAASEVNSIAVTIDNFIVNDLRVLRDF